MDSPPVPPLDGKHKYIHHWFPVVKHCCGSVFYITFDPRLDEMESIKERVNEVRTVPDSDQIKSAEQSYVCNGYVARAQDDSLLILTCAHILQHVFSGSKPITAQEVSSLFSVTALCLHHEIDFQKYGSIGERAPARAQVLAINCTSDLLLLRVRKADIRAATGGGCCPRIHRPLIHRRDNPSAGEICCFLSWLHLLPAIFAAGHVGVIRRITEMSINQYGYDVNLLEANIESEDGASGAPLLDGQGYVIGLLHGGAGGKYSYFVSRSAISKFLSEHI